MRNQEDWKACRTCKKHGKKELVGQVTPEERDEIRFLYERKNGLLELSLTLNKLPEQELENSGLYHKLVHDISDISARFQRWWDEKSQTYRWKNVDGGSWEIDFDSCNIFLRQ
ncbi:CXXX repeat peptide modification system protein [Heliobacterium gestii]|uniref:CXXX repeat peptide modification system protein n=1 Tax=Heliomicrobium gestii TaxID=2699 RepID=A0A845L8Y8_HELGE|nr:CXXX repeat peptide modification system protein [Heliomicrobium gestii]MBM7866512.1 CXXX repeat modification system protein [Heliomicrobium gestii]MZP43207.1 CXXX repeat peptide modification system protein [Heliomicrobium gestii]